MRWICTMMYLSVEKLKKLKYWYDTDTVSMLHPNHTFFKIISIEKPFNNLVVSYFVIYAIEFLFIVNIKNCVIVHLNCVNCQINVNLLCDFRQEDDRANLVWQCTFKAFV